jgi:bacteriophage exclusion system BrxC/D-like protein
MTRTTPPKPPEGLDKVQARRILASMGENGKPPENGISHVNVGNESYLKVIDATYIQDLVRSAEGSSFKLVQGTYGAGKTHFLLCVRDLAWRRDLLTAFITISAKECPFNRPLAVYRAVATRIETPRGPDGEQTRGIDDVIRAAVDKRVADDGKDGAKTWIDKLAKASLARHSFRDAAVGLARAHVDGDQSTARQLAAWLRAEELTLSDAKAVGLFELPSNDNGYGMFRSLVQLVRALGFEGVALLLDEAERAVSADAKPTKAMAETVDHLRELIDLCGRSELPRTLILYAVTPAFVENVLPLYPALQQRIGAPIQFLSLENPKAPLIDLEALDLEPKKLLGEVGKRLVRVAKRAYEWSPDDKVIQNNLDKLVSTVADEQLEVGHRRFFVKLWIRLLDQQRIGKQRALTDDEINALVRDEQALQVEEFDEENYDTFFGMPYRKNPPSKKR